MIARRRNSIWCLSLVAGLAGLQPHGLLAGVVYRVTVDTSSIHTGGFLDFGFAPGNGSQAAFVQISGFSPGGSLNGTPQVNGGVSGTLPGVLTIDNSTAFNDYFQGFNYGNTIGFLVTLSGPAINSPNGTATSGSTFGFGMFDSTGSNPLLTTDPNGNAFTIDVNLDGGTKVNNFSGQVQVAQVQLAPEPASTCVVALALLGIAAAYGRANRHSRPPR